MKKIKPFHKEPSSIAMKLRSLIQSHVLGRIPRLARSLTRAKSTLLHAIRVVRALCKRPPSHVLPVPEYAYYDATWRSIEPAEQCSTGGEESCGYLKWLEEQETEEVAEVNEEEIDKLAERFIQKCHEKFRLEKQESYRRYQEMLIRST